MSCSLWEGRFYLGILFGWGLLWGNHVQEEEFVRFAYMWVYMLMLLS